MNGDPNFRLDHVYTHFAYGLPQDVLPPYVHTVVDEASADLELDVSVAGRCVAGKNVLTLTALNADEPFVRLSTPC